MLFRGERILLQRLGRVDRFVNLTEEIWYSLCSAETSFKNLVSLMVTWRQRLLASNSHPIQKLFNAALIKDNGNYITTIHSILDIYENNFNVGYNIDISYN